MQIKISLGNKKMGAVQSVSLPAILTCRADCDCKEICYALKITKLRKQVRNAYMSNYELLKSNPEEYWRELNAAVALNRYFRFHVSGDIPDFEYLENMIDVAKRNKHCEILCFTKKYSIVNRWISEHGEIPRNLHIIFSGWRNLKMENPYKLPEAHVRFKDGYCEASENAQECGGNCSECSIIGSGCWNLKCGEQVIFNQH